MAIIMESQDDRSVVNEDDGVVLYLQASDNASVESWDKVRNELFRIAGVTICALDTKARPWIARGQVFEEYVEHFAKMEGVGIFVSVSPKDFETLEKMHAAHMHRRQPLLSLA